MLLALRGAAAVFAAPKALSLLLGMLFPVDAKRTPDSKMSTSNISSSECPYFRAPAVRSKRCPPNSGAITVAPVYLAIATLWKNCSSWLFGPYRSKGKRKGPSEAGTVLLMRNFSLRISAHPLRLSGTPPLEFPRHDIAVKMPQTSVQTGVRAMVRRCTKPKYPK